MCIKITPKCFGVNTPSSGSLQVVLGVCKHTHTQTKPGITYAPTFTKILS